MIELEPVAHVRNQRADLFDDYWGSESAEIILTDDLDADALEGIEEFSHAEIIFFFDRVDPARIERGSRHPRNNESWPRVGIFAQRGKNRPNRLGSTVVRVVGRQGRTLCVAELDAIDGTPVLDIKPVMQEFLPREPMRQPEWSHELMRLYWTRKG